MKNWINDIRNFFERKPSNGNIRIKRDRPVSRGFVRERITFFEEAQPISNKSTGSVPDDKYDRINSCHLERRRSSCENHQNYFNKSNLERTPSNVMNSDRICIYHSMDAIYGSFKIREKSVDQSSYEENEVMMRLKVREIEHLGVSRYESILKAPLSQQVILAKYKNENGSSLTCLDPICQNKVMSLIDTWNKLTLSNKEREDLIDIALLNSIQREDSILSYKEKPINVLEWLGDNQSLKWADTEKVKSMNLLDTLSRKDIFFQESQFELISSEASYYRSLNVLVYSFYNSPLLSLDIPRKQAGTLFRIRGHQKEHLFSNILQIHSTSGKFLAELERRFEESVVMTDICDIVTTFAKSQFNVYIPYLQNQKFQTEAYNELKKNEDAAKVIEELESQSECCSQTLDSFLHLPMQRLMRILLCLKAIKTNVPEGNSLSLNSVDAAIDAVDTILTQSSAKKIHMDERQRMLEISSRLTFEIGQNVLPISSGTLLCDGEVKCQRKEVLPKNYLTSYRKTIFNSFLILTNEYLLITKINRNKDSSYVVKDWCPLSEIILEKTSTNNKSRNSLEFTVGFRKSSRYIIQVETRDEYNVWIKELSNCLATEPYKRNSQKQV